MPAESYMCILCFRRPPSYVCSRVPATFLAGLIGLLGLSGTRGAMLVGMCIRFGLWLLMTLSLNMLAVRVRILTVPILLVWPVFTVVLAFSISACTFSPLITRLRKN